LEPFEANESSTLRERIHALHSGLRGAAPAVAVHGALRFLRDLPGPRKDWRNLEEIGPADLLDLADALLALLPAAEMEPAPAPEQTARHEPPLFREALWEWLDLTRRSPFLRRISGSPEGDRWMSLVLRVCDATDFTMRALFSQRVWRDPEHVWLRVVERDRIVDWTLGEVGRRVEVIARGLHALVSAAPQGQPVAILSENGIETVLADLACLTGGLVDVTIPADATGEQAAYILEQVEAQVLLVGSDRQMEKVLPILSLLPSLRSVIRIGSKGESSGPAETVPVSPGGVTLLTLAELIAKGEEFSEAEFLRRASRARMSDVATLMYTSGTTGLPKGILFSHRNIVYKRFARALALPEIGEGDHFLCYLPLYHTFGRWLEMTGSLFWGATYSFMENPSLEALLDNLRRVSPTVFISIPKKWIQLADRIRSDAPEDADARLCRPVVERLTGGRLRWGLSAAGYLDPDVFRFFHRHGVELMSGFGMTEATGGITMTPPGEYRPGTVGRALPGVEIARAEDGELLVRGPYIMKGYFGPDEAGADHDREWFHTGDIVEIDEEGFIAILDRKKDIYKNVKGQTIAPQRVESLFQPFPEIRQVFLAGDGREYNTVLIFPDYDHCSPPLARLAPDELRDYLGGILVSVNGFLAPFERILDFALLPRPLSLEEEELTPKGSYRRKIIEQHFAGLIDGMYKARASILIVGDLEVRLPHWLLRDMGLTLTDVLAGPEGLRMPRLGRSLCLEGGADPGRFRLGDLIYVASTATVDLEAILRSPELWLGNAAMIEFTGGVGIRRPQTRREGLGDPMLQVSGVAQVIELGPAREQQLSDALWREDRSLYTIHLLAVALLSSRGREGLRLINYLETLLGEEDTQRAELARIALRRTVTHPRAEIRSAAFRVLLPHGAPEMVAPTITAFLKVDPGVLNPAGALALTRRGLSEEVMAAFLTFLGQVQRGRELQRRSREKPGGRTRAAVPVLDEKQALALLRFLVVYATDHPGWFQAARQELSRWLLSFETVHIREAARRGGEKLIAGFRAWLGPDPAVAVDPTTGQEYGWSRVIRFESGCDVEDRLRIERAVASRPLIKEAIFVLSGGARVSLAEIPPGGVLVRHLGTRHGKAVYRITVQTRQHGLFEIALNLVQESVTEAIEEEVLWLTCLGSPEGGRRLVEEMGGAWPEYRLWTEEYVPGETVADLLDRVASGAPERITRLSHLWTHLATSAATAYVDFWSRTGRRLVPDDPSPDNVIVPAHDDQEGSRLISIAKRKTFEGMPAFLRALKDGLLESVGDHFPQLRGVVGCEVLYAAVLDVVGEADGSALLREMIETGSDFDLHLPGEREALAFYLEQVKVAGYMPRRLAAAIRRFHRWAAVNQEATVVARASMLRDLWDSYGLRELDDARPETRLQFFSETVFAAERGDLGETLQRLTARARQGRLSIELMLREMSELVRQRSLSEDQAYFLARLTYSHLRPADTADLALVDQGGTRVSDLVVTHRDRTGRYFRVRHAATPSEVWALHSLFRASGINIRYRAGHQFLVAVDENNRVMGGLVYRPFDATSVHMEKIVVATSHRREGISEEVMEDFFQRMRARGVKAVTTGFYRLQYFRRFRFQIDREHAGLVRILGEENPS
jgi:long-chain acyl-CoA synthetase